MRLHKCVQLHASDGAFVTEEINGRQACDRFRYPNGSAGQSTGWPSAVYVLLSMMQVKCMAAWNIYLEQYEAS